MMPVRVWESGELVYDARPRQPRESRAAYDRRVVRSVRYAARKLRKPPRDGVYVFVAEKTLR